MRLHVTERPVLHSAERPVNVQDQHPHTLSGQQNIGFFLFFFFFLRGMEVTIVSESCSSEFIADRCQLSSSSFWDRSSGKFHLLHQGALHRGDVQKREEETNGREQ